MQEYSATCGEPFAPDDEEKEEQGNDSKEPEAKDPDTDEPNHDSSDSNAPESDEEGQTEKKDLSPESAHQDDDHEKKASGCAMQSLQFPAPLTAAILGMCRFAHSRRN